MNNSRLTGSMGEDIAAACLSGKGYRILHRNWRHKHGEVDIIAMDGSTIVIAEVKTRTSGTFGRPEEFVDGHKAACLMDAADAYLHEYHEGPVELRFDIISVSIDPVTGSCEIEHLKDAFYA